MLLGIISGFIFVFFFWLLCFAIKENEDEPKVISIVGMVMIIAAVLLSSILTTNTTVTEEVKDFKIERTSRATIITIENFTFIDKSIEIYTEKDIKVMVYKKFNYYGNLNKKVFYINGIEIGSLSY